MIQITLLFIVFAVILYQTFVSDNISALKNGFFQGRAAKDRAAKIAQVKLVSDDRKDIEKFVSDNANYLSDATVKKLVARIEAIKDDRVILDDEIKLRIDALNNKQPPAEEVVAQAPVYSGRRGGAKRA